MLRWIWPGSPSYGKWVGAELSAENHQQLWVPVGFAHGFLTLSELAEVQYKASDFWDQDCERSMRWNDPTLQISWPLKRAASRSRCWPPRMGRHHFWLILRLPRSFLMRICSLAPEDSSARPCAPPCRPSSLESQWN